MTTTWVLLAGAPATGKTTLAAALERRLHAVTLNKDRVREVLFPGSLTDYSAEQDDLCMHAITEAAVYLTKHASPGFLCFDGRAFSQRRQIEEIVTAAENAGAAWKIVHLICEDQVAAQRLSGQDAAHPARNRDFALYLRVKRSFEPILYPKLNVDTTDGIDPHVDAVCRYLGDESEEARHA